MAPGRRDRLCACRGPARGAPPVPLPFHAHIELVAQPGGALVPKADPKGHTPSGRTIRRTQPIKTINEILSFVARGVIVHPTNATVPVFDRADVVLIPFEDMPRIPLGLVWCTSRENPRIRALDDTARALAGT